MLHRGRCERHGFGHHFLQQRVGFHQIFGGDVLLSVGSALQLSPKILHGGGGGKVDIPHVN